MGLSTYIIDPNRSKEMRTILIQLNRLLFFVTLPLSLLSLLLSFLAAVAAYIPRLTVKNVLALKAEELYAKRGGTEPLSAIIEEAPETDETNPS